MRIDFLKEQAPDATTLLHFRHLIENNGIAKLIFDDVRDRLDKAGLLMHGGTVVDATIVAAPSSTKNQSGERDPEMHQTKKGNGWHYGMKIHSGVDAGSGYVHTITATSANKHDITETAKLIRKDDAVVYDDSGYLGIEKKISSTIIISGNSTSVSTNGLLKTRSPLILREPIGINR
jgi:IS5 family transposase